ncbi:unnamed protein product, partial [Effrenium voratum]
RAATHSWSERNGVVDCCACRPAAGMTLEAGFPQQRRARLCAAFRDFDTRQSGKINRTFVEALIHLSVTRELTNPEEQQLSNLLDSITDADENVDYGAFVGWLHSPGSQLPELVLSQVGQPRTPRGGRPLSGRTLANVVRHKVSGPVQARVGASLESRSTGRSSPMQPPLATAAWPSIGVARSSRLASPEQERFPVPRPGQAIGKKGPLERRRNFPGSRPRSVAAVKVKARPASAGRGRGYGGYAFCKDSRSLSQACETLKFQPGETLSRARELPRAELETGQEQRKAKEDAPPFLQAPSARTVAAEPFQDTAIAQAPNPLYELQLQQEIARQQQLELELRQGESSWLTQQQQQRQNEE